MCRRCIVLAPLMLIYVGVAFGQYGYHFGRNKIQYEDFDWHVLKTEHFDIYHYPEMQELAEHGAHFAEEAYTDLQTKFNFSLNHRVPIIFYSSNLHFKQTNITPGFIPDGVGGFFEFLKGRVVIPANGNLHRFRRVIRHEMVHVFTYNRVIRVMRDHRIPPDSFLPLWFTEGLAEYWSGEPDYNHEMVMRDAIYSNYLVPLESIFRINGSFLMYKQGEAVCRFIAERYGEEKLLDLMENFWKERDFRRVLQIVLRDDIDNITAGWQEWLKAQYYPELDDIEIPAILAKGVSAGGFNAKPAFYRFADGTRKVFFVANKTGYSNVYEVEVDSLYRPRGKPQTLIRGERSDKFEAFHLFESRISVSASGQLAFVTKSGERDVVHLYDLEDDRLMRTVAFNDLIAVYSPDWSPDGRSIVFSSIDAAGFSDLYTYSLDADELRRVTNDHYDDRDPSWSPDGRHLIFSSDRTATGSTGAYNLFTYGVYDGQIRYVTYGDRNDLSPRWSPDGRYVVFSSTKRDTDGRYGAQNLWVAEILPPPDEQQLVSAGDPPTLVNDPIRTARLQQLTDLTSAAFDPVWTTDGQIVFTSFEAFRFSIRSTPVDSLLADPEMTETSIVRAADEPWTFGRLGTDEGASRGPYKRRYKLDIAQGAVQQSPVLGTTGGAVVAFSDMLGDDHLYVTMFNTSESQRNFLRNLSFAATRVQLQRRSNIAYGVYRFTGRRYDIRDPDAPAGLPVFQETIYGAFGGVSYPLSKFRRLGVNTSLNFSDKQIAVRGIDREALLLSNSVSLTHDNALYSMNGPIAGWRASLTTAYTTDIANSNVSYFTLDGDVRRYLRIVRGVTFASRGSFRWNEGREARLFILGGSWDLRGFRLFSVRGQRMWFTSHELRFPILEAPSLYIPILSPFGVANFRGAFFFDAAHAWNTDYDRVQREINSGETLGALGVGFRLNLFGGFVLRYDIGYRYRDSFRERDKKFRQFFFGYDF